MTTPKTLSEALQSGYVVTDSKLQRGYVSRKIPIGDCPIHTAGGSRNGEIYALLPNWKSSQYAIRLYLMKKV